MSSDKIWWYAKGDQRQGPYTAAELKALVASGQIAATDMVWKEGLANWVPASSVAGLFPSGGTGAPPPLPATQVGSDQAAPAPRRKMHGALKAVLWVVGALVVLIVIVAIFGSNDTKSPSFAQVTSSTSNKLETTSAAPASTPAPPALKVGDTFETPTFQMQIASAQLRQSVGDSMFGSKASQGGVYVAIQWRYKNISKKPVGSFDLPTLHLIAPDGTKYDPDLGASGSYATELNTNTKVLSDLNPGIQVTDADVFEVSQEQFNPTSWKILVDADENAKIAFVTSDVPDTAGSANPTGAYGASGDSAASGVPQFQKDEPYGDVRTKLLAAGWQPFHANDADTCESGDPRCEGRPEMESCAGTGLANCKFLWKKQSQVLAICTVGEENAVFDGICSDP
ncbi:GYF domain-containing protein [Rhodanobacter thiooxydans]|uniref:GYF domain-containing protein n=1 Tax=Rhodanobacter thiooxydans TaxID=416169 RepID=UPI000260FC1C|nr:GYF domain-containing protein [Rhodanobacter thiooxydans]EIL97930.1 hypothetical protein UUA_13265 [Rhodanobacter thiooxydans LCS2]MCW0203076.1 GYF domain-containing protein [Rhodanobacter thiooxydans]